jgi:hypothetical protein
MRKRSDSTSNWEMVDIMRGMPNNTANAQPALQANLSAAESSTSMYILPTATGFIDANCANSSTYIYMAIRRPMKVPTTGTSVFSPSTYTGDGTNSQVVTGASLPPDLVIGKSRDNAYPWYWNDRLRGASALLVSNTTAAEGLSSGYYVTQFNQNSDTLGISNYEYNTNGGLYEQFIFSRRPGFFDEVCYTGTGLSTTQVHNLGVAPELMIVKRRSTTGAWYVYSKSIPNTSSLVLNTTAAEAFGSYWDSTDPTSSVFSITGGGAVNGSGSTYVAYLFATCPGVSKVGSYTGTGATQTINCGFTGGARFVLIKRTDSTGDWYVWDTARGMVSGNDPYFLLNSTAAEVTSTDYIDPVSSGFEISSTAPAAINANGGSFIFLAIA